MKILIADDHQLMLAGMRQVLELDGGFEVVAEAYHGTEVVPLVGQTQPEVVLLDIRMPGLDGLVCLDRLRSRYPEVRVVMCSMSSDPEQIQSAFKRGACGYIVKSINPRDLGSAIRQAVDGTAYHARGLPCMDEDSAEVAAAELRRIR
jgi:DNA-binding NarL/FixJ family response regulator